MMTQIEQSTRPDESPGADELERRRAAEELSSALLEANRAGSGWDAFDDEAFFTSQPRSFHRGVEEEEEDESLAEISLSPRMGVQAYSDARSTPGMARSPGELVMRRELSAMDALPSGVVLAEGPESFHQSRVWPVVGVLLVLTGLLGSLYVAASSWPKDLTPVVQTFVNK